MSRTMILMKDLIDEITMGPFGSDIKVDNFIDDGVPVLNGSNVGGVKLTEDSFKYISEEKAKSLKKANSKRGDIVITHRGTLGQISYIPENSKYTNYVISQSQFRVTLKREHVDPAFFTYYFHSPEGQKRLLSFKNHVGVPALAQATTNFRLLEFPIIPLQEQLQIAKVLSGLDTKIELNNKINAELEALAKTLYNYWFVQFDFPDKNGKPYKSSGGQMVYNEVLKRGIPEGWAIENILYLSKLLGGGTPSTHNEEYWRGDIPFFTPSDANKAIFSLSTMDCITKRGLKESSTKLFQKGTIFLTARGSVGNIMIASKPMAMNQSCYALKPNDSNYIFLYFSAVSMIGYLKAKSSGSVFNSIVSNDIKYTPVLIPSTENRDLFEKLVSPVFEKILSNLKQSQELIALRDWLLPMLMNGQVKVASDYTEKREALSIAAEPQNDYGSAPQLNIPGNKKPFAKQVLAGEIVTKFQNDPNFTEIKFQKIQFLAEHIIEADLNLNYYYQVAGPYDNKFMHTIYDNFHKQKWFDCRNGKIIPLEKHEKIETYYHSYFAHAEATLNKLFNLLHDSTEAQAEIIATLYAVWNNRIIEGKPVTDDDVIMGFYNWSKRKQQYSEKQIREGLQWLRDNQMEPKGFGKVIKMAKTKKI